MYLDVQFLLNFSEIRVETRSDPECDECCERDGRQEVSC